MSNKITNKEYVKILEYYKLPIPKTRTLTKLAAEKILVEKLCRCIKKLDVEYKARSIGICTKTIFNRKGYTRGKITCKGRKSVSFYKTKKTRKNKKKKK